MGATGSVQTADQTIVYRSGNNADLGLLALTILRLRGIKAELAITADDAYLISDPHTYSVMNRSEVAEVTGNVHYHLK